MPSSNEQSETVFYQVEGAIVTNTRFITGGQTFAIQKIALVKGVENPPRYSSSIAGIVSGLTISFVGFTGFGLIIGGIGILIVVLSIGQMIRQRRFYSIVLGIGGTKSLPIEAQAGILLTKLFGRLTKRLLRADSRAKDLDYAN